PRAHRARHRHPRVYPAAPGMALLGDTRGVAVEERARDVHARARVTRDLEDQRVTDLQDGLRHHRVPVEPGDREVLTEAARDDRMAFCPQRLDRLHREDADRTLRPAVVLVITVVSPSLVRPGRVPVTISASSATTWSRPMAPSFIGMSTSPASSRAPA